MLIVLTEANFIDIDSDGYTDKFFNGKYADFSVNWYLREGSVLISTMIFWSIWNIVDILFEWILRSIARAYDSYGSTEDEPTTRKHTIQTYINTHAGPDFHIEYNYSSILI